VRAKEKKHLLKRPRGEGERSKTIEKKGTNERLVQKNSQGRFTGVNERVSGGIKTSVGSNWEKGEEKRSHLGKPVFKF